MKFFLNGACAVHGGIPVRMLEITSQCLRRERHSTQSPIRERFTQTTYTTENSMLARCPYLTLATPHIAGVTLRRKKPYRNDVKCTGRTYVCGFAYLANLHTQRGNRQKRHLAASVNMHLRSDGVLRRTSVGSSPASGVSCFVDTRQRYAGATYFFLL